MTKSSATICTPQDEEAKSHSLHAINNNLMLASEKNAAYLQTINDYSCEMQAPENAPFKAIFADGIRILALHAPVRSVIFVPAVALLLQAATDEPDDLRANPLYCSAVRLIDLAPRDLLAESWTATSELVLDALAVQRQNKLGQANLLSCFVHNGFGPLVTTPAIDAKIDGLKTLYASQIVPPKPMEMASQQQIYTMEIVAGLNRLAAPRA